MASPNRKKDKSTLVQGWQFLEALQMGVVGTPVAILAPMLLTGRGSRPTYAALAAILPAIVAFVVCYYVVAKAEEFKVQSRRLNPSPKPDFFDSFGVLIIVSPVAIISLIVFGALFGWMAMALMMTSLLGTLLGACCHLRGLPLFPLPLSFLLPLEKLIPYVPGKSSGSLGLIILLLGAAVFLIPPLAFGWSVVPFLDDLLSSESYEPIVWVLLIHPFATPYLWVGRGSDPMEGLLLLGISFIVMLPPCVALLRERRGVDRAA